MLKVRRLKWLGLLFLLTLAFAIMAPAAMGSSHNSTSEPSIQILEPESGDNFSGKLTIRVSVEGGKGQMTAIYFDMVGLSHDMIMGDNYHKTVEVDTSKYYDGEHLINVHVHPTSGSEFHVAKLKIVTSNGNPAPNGDWSLPTLEFLQHTYQTDAQLLFTRVRLKDDGPIEGAQVLTHINRALARSARPATASRSPDSSGPPVDIESTGLTEVVFNAIYRTHLLPFQTNAPQETTVRFFITDAVGRANLVDLKALIPANTSEQQAIRLPKAKIVNIEMFQDFLPDRVHVKLENAHMATHLVLWLGDKVISRVPLDGTETDIEMPINASNVAAFFRTKIGDSARATAVWMEFRANVSEFPELDKLSPEPKQVSIPVLGHKHINPVDPNRPLRATRANFKTRLWLQDQTGQWRAGKKVQPIIGDWTKVTFAIPSGLTFPIKRLGFNFMTHRSMRISGPVYIDHITIGSKLTYSFEQGHATPWAIAPWTKKDGGISSIGISAAQARDGMRSMEVMFSGQDSKGFVELQAPADVTQGDVLTLYVYTPNAALD